MEIYDVVKIREDIFKCKISGFLKNKRKDRRSLYLIDLNFFMNATGILIFNCSVYCPLYKKCGRRSVSIERRLCSVITKDFFKNRPVPIYYENIKKILL